MITYENKGFRLLPKKLIIFTLKVFDRVSLFLVRLKVSPNFLSLLGLAAGIMVGIFFGLNLPLWSLIFLAFCGMLDILDGKVATNSNKKTLFGAVFDSTLDRYSEFAIYLGLAYYFKNPWILLLLALAFLGSTMVSYTRSRAEGLGIDCRLGIMQRAERMVLMILGTLVGILTQRFDLVMTITIIILAVVSHITAWQRLVYVYRFERRNKPH